MLRDTYAKDVIDKMNQVEFVVTVTTFHEVKWKVTQTTDIYDKITSAALSSVSAETKTRGADGIVRLESRFKTALNTHKSEMHPMTLTPR